MKVFKHRNLMGLIYSVLLALPLCSILGRVLYVQWNKNAKDSYSGETTYTINYKYQSNEVNNSNDIHTGNIYNVHGALYQNELVDQWTFEIISGEAFCYYEIDDVTEDDGFFYSNIEYNLSFNYISFYNGIYVNLNINELHFENAVILVKNINGNITKYSIFSNTNYNEIESVNIDTSGTLDNAFSYSVNELIKDNNFGEVNFVGLFDDLFLDSSNQVNALYLHFANWYMNYVLFISIVYILFLVLMWFINFIRKMLEQGMDFGSRGY